MRYEKTSGGVLVPSQKILGYGRYKGQIIRDGKVIDEWEDTNIVVNEGLNATLNIMFNSSTQLTAWYLGLFQGNYSPVSTDTAATIATNSTECSSYTAGTRQTWTPAAASGQSITNSASRASFTFNASVTVYGAFLVSSPTIGGTSGTLFSAAQFGASKAVVNLDQLLLTYTFTAASV